MMMEDLLQAIREQDKAAAAGLINDHLVDGRFLVTREQYKVIVDTCAEHSRIPLTYTPAVASGIPIVVIEKGPAQDIGHGKSAIVFDGDIYVFERSKLGMFPPIEPDNA